MKRFCLVLFFAIVYVLPSVAQDDYRLGYVVTHAGDTLKGTVLFLNGLAKHQSCIFKNSGGQVTTYQPADITAYGFSGVSFYEAVPDKGQFMEVLVLGRLDLLAIVGNLFLRDSAGKLHALESLTKQSEKQGTTYVFEQKEYLGILRWQMADCNKVQSRIREIPLKIRPLTWLVSQYNECIGEEATTVVPSASSRQHLLRAGIILMSGQGKVNKLDDNSQVVLRSYGAIARLGDLADVKEFSKISAFSYGIFFNAGIPRIHERLSFSIECLLQQYELSSSRSREASVMRTYHNSVSMSVKSIKIPLYIQYVWTGKSKVQPLLFIGASGGFDTSSNSGTVTGDSEEDTPGHFITTTFYKDVFIAQDFTLSVLGGAGVRAAASERFSLELKARYERGGGPFGFRAFSNAGKSTSYQVFAVSLGCSYRL